MNTEATEAAQPEAAPLRDEAARRIYSSVLEAMQEAEEMSGDMPGDDYVLLMQRIAMEAMARATRCATTQGMHLFRVRSHVRTALSDAVGTLGSVRDLCQKLHGLLPDQDDAIGNALEDAICAIRDLRETSGMIDDVEAIADPKPEAADRQAAPSI